MLLPQAVTAGIDHTTEAASIKFRGSTGSTPKHSCCCCCLKNMDAEATPLLLLLLETQTNTGRTGHIPLQQSQTVSGLIGHTTTLLLLLLSQQYGMHTSCYCFYCCLKQLRAPPATPHHTTLRLLPQKYGKHMPCHCFCCYLEQIRTQRDITPQSPQKYGMHRPCHINPAAAAVKRRGSQATPCHCFCCSS